MQIDEDLVRLLLPYLLHGLAPEGEKLVSSDYMAASNMILVQLCSVTTLAQDFLEGEYCRTFGRDSLVDRCTKPTITLFILLEEEE